MIKGLFSFKKVKAWVLNLKGISTKCYAYKGPDLVQIDCTDKCNSRCLACWVHSPLLNSKENKDFLDIEPSILKRFIREAKKSGTREVCFSGGGEPFLYEHIWEILEFTQKNSMPFRINTNFTLLSKRDIKRLLSYNKLASLTVSIWAPDAGLYSELHGRNKESFDSLISNLRFLNKLKTPRLNVIVYSVMTSMNYFASKALTNLARETGCSGIEFALIDAIPANTDSLLLNENQLSYLKSDFLGLIRQAEDFGKAFKIINKELFLRRLSCPGASCGEYDAFVDRIPCYSGWVFLRLRANGDLNSCLKSHKIPIGNIYNESFLSIWNNASQQEFRRKCLALPKDKEYFKVFGNGNSAGIGCRRSCDNIFSNEHAGRLVKYLIKL
ncbi:MAG: radical SAM protein [Candidatus Omnitrophica bacterium]|nr:radical SAM protein [Candidatus Omnitrophota bacterium]MDD5660757.1 radical SAM protein [Candidatus Omnitrophota bacterium]